MALLLFAERRSQQRHEGSGERVVPVARQHIVVLIDVFGVEPELVANSTSLTSASSRRETLSALPSHTSPQL